MTPTTSRLSRRSLIGTSLAGAALVPLAPLAPSPHASSGLAAAAAQQDAVQQDAASELATWKMWYLDAPDALRPPAPGPVSAEEIDAVVEAQAAPTAAMTDAVRAWGGRAATTPWTTQALAAFSEARVNGFRQTRNLALLQTAMHDAAVAAWDAQLAYARPSPAATDERIVPAAGADPALPTYPSQSAAVAGAAATVLAYLLPDAARGRFDELAEEAAISRVWAGEAFPSDVEAGLALGRAVGELAVERGQDDGADAVFDPAEMPSGPGFWEPTPPAFPNPVEPLGGAWQTWILSRGDDLRPAPPPVYDSPAWRAELLVVQRAVHDRTLSQQADAAWWQAGYPRILFELTEELIARRGLATPHAARVQAYQAVALADAMIAVWDGKYLWWMARPITVDPELVTAFPTPPYPSYPAGYPASVGAWSQIGGLFFPEAAEQLEELAWRAMRSRTWAGIHFNIDSEAGLTIGRQVARLAAIRAMDEGAIPV